MDVAFSLYEKNNTIFNFSPVNAILFLNSFNVYIIHLYRIFLIYL